ncbi:matrixin family metalloprotease [Streptomyces sp. NPDC088812]|uniref:matrixin family metalloprotease n=1 Tax=Streptomyces sp. NPDC088812 TaxID=3365905 RepID=UPI0037F3574D
MTGRHGPQLAGRVVAAVVLAVSVAVVGGGDEPTRAGGEASTRAGGGCVLGRGALTPDDLPAGSSVLDCAAVGRLVTHAGAGVTVPEPGTKVTVDALSVDGTRHGFTLEVAADGTVSYDYDLEAGAGEAGEAGEAAPAAPASEAGSEEHTRAAAPAARAARRAPCADSAYAVADHKEYGTYDWWLGDDSLPGNLSAAEARRAFEDALTAITGTRNDCGFGDAVGARTLFHGRTHHEADIDQQARCAARDGVSVWDAGNLSGGVVATTCSWSRPMSGRPDWLKEADVRFNTSHYTFTNNPTGDCTDAYDIRSVATHEAGHVFGLAHVGPGHEGQTMFTNSFACTTDARTLGRGDVLGLRNLY